MGTALTLREVITTTVFTYFVVLIIAGIRRVYFHPLSKYPGPRFAALTKWWQTYYDVARHGKLLDELGHLHEIYGPIVRFGPNQLHFSDPRVYGEIYAPGSPYTKDPKFYQCFAANESAFGSIDRRDVKRRRDILAPFFSRRAILKLENVVQDKINKLISQLATYKSTPVNMHYAFRSATLDIIMEYLFANTLDALDAKDFHHPVLCGLQEGLPAFWLLKHFPWMFPIMMSAPPEFVMWANPPARGILTVLMTCETQISGLLANPDSLYQADHEIVYHHLMNPDPEKRGAQDQASKSRLLDEAHTLLNAGSDTVGGTCTNGVFQVLNNPAIFRRLREELDGVVRDGDEDAPLNLEVLEKLPYLTAVIKESLRVTHGVITPLPRIVGDDTVIGGYHVPAGTIVSIGCTFVHNSETIFTNPTLFDPDRWLQPDSKELDKYLVPFGTGPRQCLGMNLAWAELYLIFGNVLSKLDLTIHNTTVDDFEYDEFFLPVYRGNQFHAYIKERRA